MRRGVDQTDFLGSVRHIGLVENSNRLVLERLRRICNVSQNALPGLDVIGTMRNWSDSLQEATQFINDRRLTFLANYSPREVLFGLSSTRPWTGQEGQVNTRFVQVDEVRTDVALAYKDEQQARKDRSTE